MKTLLAIAILLVTATPSNAQLGQIQIDTSVSSMEFDSWMFEWRPVDMLVGIDESVTATPIDPRFKQSPQGWVPSCPTGTTLVRHDPAPDCIWATRPLAHKPTMGDMDCMDTAKVKKLPACPAE